MHYQATERHTVSLREDVSVAKVRFQLTNDCFLASSPRIFSVLPQYILIIGKLP